MLYSWSCPWEKVALGPQVALLGLQPTMPKVPDTWGTVGSEIKCESNVAPFHPVPTPTYPLVRCASLPKLDLGTLGFRGKRHLPPAVLKHFSSWLGKKTKNKNQIA